MGDDIETDAIEEDIVAPEDQQGLIDDLLSDEPVKEEAQEEEEVVEEKPEEEPEKVEEEEKEKPEVEEEKPEEEIKEEPSKEEEEEEVTEDDPLQVLLDRNDKLSDQIIAMAEQGFGIKSPDAVEEAPSEEEEPKKTETPEPIKLEELKIEDFLTEDELDRVNDHPELMNEAFNRAMKTVMEHINTALNVIGPLQQEVKALPKQVSKAVGSQLEFNTIINDFYDDNPDLKGKASRLVHITYKSLLTDAQKEGKKTTIGELYNQAGDEVREMLNITKEQTKPGERKPALPGANTPARKQKTPKTSSEQQTQADLMAYVTSD